MTRAQPQRPGTWAGKMVPHGKVLAAKADDLSLGLRTHMVYGEN